MIYRRITLKSIGGPFGKPKYSNYSILKWTVEGYSISVEQRGGSYRCVLIWEKQSWINLVSLLEYEPPPRPALKPALIYNFKLLR